MKRQIILGFLCLIIFLSCSFLYRGILNNLPFVPGFVINRVRQTQVIIGQGEYSGQGVIYKQNEDGIYIITAKHIIPKLDAYYTVRFYNNSIRTAKVIRHFKYNDLGILYIKGEHFSNPPKIKPVKLGMNIFVFKNISSFVFNDNTSSGKIHNLYFQFVGKPAYLSTTAFGFFGSSGGGAYTYRGDLVGIISLIIPTSRRAEIVNLYDAFQLENGDF